MVEPTPAERRAFALWLVTLALLGGHLALRFLPATEAMEASGVQLGWFVEDVALAAHPVAMTGWITLAVGVSILPFSLRRARGWTIAWGHASAAAFALALLLFAEWTLTLATACTCVCEASRRLHRDFVLVQVALAPTGLLTVAALIGFWWTQLHARRAPSAMLEAMRAVVVAALPCALTLLGLLPILLRPSSSITALASGSGLGAVPAIVATCVGGFVLGAGWLRANAPPEPPGGD